MYVLYAFHRKTQKTTKQDIETGQQRYQQMMEYRESQKQRDSKNE
jgi:phage-related protein